MPTIDLRPTSVWTSMLGVSLLAASAHSQADQVVCDQLDEASRSSYSQMSGVDSKIAGTDLSNEARAIFDHHDSQQCEVVHEEAVNGDPAVMYHQHLKAAAGSTDSYIWVAKKSGRVLREETDIDVSNKGKGHQSLRFNYP
jgi:hypothetical protein